MESEALVDKCENLARADVNDLFFSDPYNLVKSNTAFKVSDFHERINSDLEAVTSVDYEFLSSSSRTFERSVGRKYWYYSLWKRA